MLEWLNIGAKVILVLISNVIDLTVKLDSKLQSRWKFETIIFQPYSHNQIESIIYHKYKDIRSLCKRDAIAYISKRIYNINSDIRTLDKIYARIISQYNLHGKKTLDIDSVKLLIYDESTAPIMQTSYAIIIRILHKAEKKSEVSG
jgi:Cdc6-like AAA superfamily ATPase